MLMVYLLLAVIILGLICSYIAAYRERRTAEWWSDVIDVLCLSWLFHIWED